MGLTKTAPKTLDILCRDALFFLILSEGSACGIDRSDNPDFFRGIPENFLGFVSRQKVEEIARTILGQEVYHHIAFEGSYFDGNGYFLDFYALSDQTGNVCNLSSDDLLPGYANLEMMESIGENGWKMSGSLRRFKEVDGNETIWNEAEFHVILQYQDGKLQFKNFEITERPMS